MKVSQLLQGLCAVIGDNVDRDVRLITENSRACSSDSLFVCIRGAKVDGHAYAEDAYRRGCRLFVAERSLSLPEDASVYLVENSEIAFAMLARRFYGDPSQEMKLVGITGTKGKTTAAVLTEQLLCRMGISCGYIGTNGISFGKTRIPTRNTTPDAVTLQSGLRQMKDAGYGSAILETSSQAPHRHRADGTRFTACAFMNLFPDHIGPGEHADLEDYRRCKERLFCDFSPSIAILNADDPETSRILQITKAEKIVTFGLNSPADYRAERITPIYREGFLGEEILLVKEGRRHVLRIPLIGLGNVSSALAALAIAVEVFGRSISDAAQELEYINVRGRSQAIPLPNGAIAVIDYAHNGPSLRQLLSELRAVAPARLITLFGSVGERTQMRRAELGSVAAELSDLCILTSDNPGCEPPEQIIAQIAESFSNATTPYLPIPDRKEAILQAVKLSRRGDVIVLAGKGHEEYQLIGDQRVPFSEEAILRSLEEAPAVP